MTAWRQEYLALAYQNPWSRILWAITSRTRGVRRASGSETFPSPKKYLFGIRSREEKSSLIGPHNLNIFAHYSSLSKGRLFVIAGRISRHLPV